MNAHTRLRKRKSPMLPLRRPAGELPAQCSRHSVAARSCWRPASPRRPGIAAESPANRLPRLLASPAVFLTRSRTILLQSLPATPGITQRHNARFAILKFGNQHRHRGQRSVVTLWPLRSTPAFTANFLMAVRAFAAAVRTVPLNRYCQPPIVPTNPAPAKHHKKSVGRRKQPTIIKTRKKRHHEIFEARIFAGG